MRLVVAQDAENLSAGLFLLVFRDSIPLFFFTDVTLSAVVRIGLAKVFEQQP